jgi:hypothetical protein
MPRSNATSIVEDVDAVLADINAAVDTARGRASIANRSDECS